MASADVQQPPAEPAPGVPDYLASPNAVFDDEGVQWRYGRAPDYSKTRKVWEDGRKMHHEAGSLPQLVENLVKNWEVEASFKPRLQDWRTIDHKNYTFAINGGPPQTAEHMLKVGTYNAIIAPNEYYSPENSDFASSHKTFKRMMPTFAWEVLEVYSGPPKVAFKWRHWGVMKNDYVGFNDKGDKVTAKAHGGPIDIEGVTVASVDDAVRLQSVETWFDPLEMFRQIAPKGIVNKEVMNRKVAMEDALDAAKPDMDVVKIAQVYNDPSSELMKDVKPEVRLLTRVSSSTGEAADAFVPHQGADVESTAVETGCVAKTEDAPTIAQQLVEAAAVQGTDADIIKPETNFEEKHSDTSSDTDKSWEKVEEQDSSLPDDAVNPAAAATLHADDLGTNPTPSTTDDKGYPFNNSTDASSADNAFDASTDSNAVLQPSIYSSAVTGHYSPILAASSDPSFVDESRALGTFDAVDEHLESSAKEVHPFPSTAEEAVHPGPGEAVVAPAGSEEVRLTHEEMSSLGNAGGCPFLMNRE
ncbi:hypothetical protein B0A48_11850 [Cryoendolithus antarcticus]|uniref:Pathogen-related protein n=1 Tax=Cryoendolithus antarcticus TaxID=1507870 RepID=A0A1V8ST20_9PEZI|nr:hypothetical protein B0A48_11850 [Cryoendolithus antarcticus]